MNKVLGFGLLGLLSINTIYADTQTGSDTNDTERIQCISDEYAILGTNVIADLHSAKTSVLVWPTSNDEHRASRCVDTNNKAFWNAINSTEDWIEEFLCREWFLKEPGPCTSWIPLKHWYNGEDDVLCVRYKIGEYLFQIFATSHVISIAIKDEALEPFTEPLGVEEAKQRVFNMASRFFKYSEPVRTIPMDRVKRTSCGVQGRFGTGKELSQWDYSSWWTDGNTVLFQIRKYADEGFEPKVPTDWLPVKEDSSLELMTKVKSIITNSVDSVTNEFGGF